LKKKPLSCGRYSVLKNSARKLLRRITSAVSFPERLKIRIGGIPFAKDAWRPEVNILKIMYRFDTFPKMAVENPTKLKSITFDTQ